MAKNLMVGEEDVEFSNSINTLQKSAGKNVPLKQKGNFERFPHLIIPLPDCARYLARVLSVFGPECPKLNLLVS